MEISTMNEETERVSADLLATSVSKAVLAKEVLRLKQVYSIFMSKEHCTTSSKPSISADWSVQS